MDKQLLDTGWEYTEGPVTFPGPPKEWQPVALPHDAAISRPRAHENPTGGAGGFAWSGVVTYRKRLQAPSDWRGRVVMLEFEGVYGNAEVLVNGNMAALHPYGYTSFLVDISPYLVYEAENEIMVVANNSAQPNSRWYSGTGIYRHVWLHTGGEVHIPPWGVFVSCPQVDQSASSVAVSTRITNAGAAAASAMLRTTVADPDGYPVAETETAIMVPADATMAVDQSLTVAGARLWSLDDCSMYSVTSEVVVDSKVIDAETTSFGIRYIAVDAKDGLRLNGVPLKLRGGCVHHDHGLLGAASYDRAEERKVELLKSSGFNAIRCAHNPPAPALLDACDRLGMLVIDESLDCWRMAKNPNDYHLYFEDWWQRDTESMVRRDRNHPSVIMWSIGNEVPERTGASDGYEWCQRQADYVRSLDGTRPVTAALATLFEEGGDVPSDGPPDAQEFFGSHNRAPADPESDRWGRLTAPFLGSLDVAGYNYYNHRYEYDQTHFPSRVICGTETFPHRAYETWQDTARLPNVIGDFVWTAFDYRGESGVGKVSIGAPAGLFFAVDPWPYHLAGCGDIDICGFKRPQSYYRDILWGVRQAPFIGVLNPQHFGKIISFNPWGWEPVSDDWTFPGQEGKPTQVEVYSADEEVELLVNGTSVGRKAAGAANQNKAVFEVVYQPGEIVAVGLVDGRETARTTLKTATAPVALRLTPDRTVIRAAYGDLVYVTVEIVDREGVVVNAARPAVSVDVVGAGELIAVGTADPVSLESCTGTKCTAFEGRLLGIVRSTGEAGEIRVNASAEGLAPAETQLTTG
jgi:beta-galactosidase